MTIAKPMNKLAVQLVKKIIDNEKEFKVISLNIGGAVVVDAGIKTQGSSESGLIISQICLGGLANLSLTHFLVDEIILPAVVISTNHPVEACIASQLAGWRIQIKDFFANGSGPARILAKKPKKIFEAIGYEEQSDEAVLVLETDRYPTEEVVNYVAKETKIKPDNLYIVLVSPSSIAGSIQVSARIVETGIFKMHAIGYNIKTILYGFGTCPISPLHPDPLIMAGRTNDMLLYGGSTFYIVEYEDNVKLKEIVEKTPSSASKDYGKSFTELVKIYGWDFLYKVDPTVFAPAMVTVNNIKTGAVYKAGSINIEILKKSFII